MNRFSVIKIWVAVLAAMLGLAGCSHTASRMQDNRPQAWFAPGVSIQLPSLEMTPELQEKQLLTGNFKGRTQSLLVLLDADAGQISLAGLSTMGIRLFKIVYDTGGIHTEQMIVAPQLPPASQVLSDIMLSYWPIEAWQTYLPAGWVLQDKENRRELRDAMGNLIVEIIYQKRNERREPVGIRQHAFDYEIKIQSL